ncbi:MAG TPA: extracellular solute-binding protein [Geminicoccus sp.]|jgi:spermidine/putrescine transport system substrate-binding protein|uniref:extracellular solute-binding protein n=1 Tax=Geminicoccus sp. TaxID=2024832 RepID=UPI002E2ECCEC|nr:extracellular solute-binding protein [Geminicoccus sp.]HEX2527850.1 extracellular solute-binding protein [Geminicoccus sp.]
MNKFLATTAAVALLVGGTAGAQADTVNLYSWTNYTPPELLKKFEAETGTTVVLDVYDSNETLLAKLQAGATGYDVVVPSDYMVGTMIQADLLEPFDAKTLDGFSNVDEKFTDPWFDPGRQYSIPYMWGTTGFTYDSARVPGGKLEESWKSFFEPPEELRGQIAALNDEVELWNAAAYFTGIDVCSEDSKDAQKILAVLENQKPFLAMYQSDGAIERMTAGEVIMHHQWNGSAHRTKMNKPSVIYVYPKEGITMWQDNFVVPKGAPNKEGARKFLAWMMKPENIAQASNFTGYNNGIKGSTEFMEPALANDPAVVAPPEYADRLKPARECGEKTRELRNRVFTRLKK